MKGTHVKGTRVKGTRLSGGLAVERAARKVGRNGLSRVAGGRSALAR